MEYVALLRGINVGGKNKVVMSELREQVADVGYANVRTYINSGNLLFEADAPREVLSCRSVASLEWFPRNVARNSPSCISRFEIGSLKFCGFLDTYEK